MTYEEQVRHYADVRRRLFNPPCAVQDPARIRACHDVKVEKEEAEPKPEKKEKRITGNGPRAARKRHYKRLAAQFEKRETLILDNPGKVQWIDIANRVTLETGVTFNDMVGFSRRQEIARAREKLCRLMRAEIVIGGYPVSEPWIAEKVQRDASTVHYYLVGKKKRK